MGTDFIPSLLLRDQKWFLKEARETIKVKTVTRHVAVSAKIAIFHTCHACKHVMRKVTIACFQ